MFNKACIFLLFIILLCFLFKHLIGLLRHNTQNAPCKVDVVAHRLGENGFNVIVRLYEINNSTPEIIPDSLQTVEYIENDPQFETCANNERAWQSRYCCSPPPRVPLSY